MVLSLLLPVPLDLSLDVKLRVGLDDVHFSYSAAVVDQYHNENLTLVQPEEV